MTTLAERLDGGLIPAVPVPFRGTDMDSTRSETMPRWMARQPVAGVAVWAHTGRGPHLSGEARREVLDTWREALPDRVVVAGARDIGMAIEARRGKADALLAFPQHDDPIGYHQRLSRELPVIAFYLYQAAGGVDYDDRTLHRILELPGVIGIKVATLDSVMTFQRIAAVLRDHPSKLLITGEDRFLGYSLLLGARAALDRHGSRTAGSPGRSAPRAGSGGLAPLSPSVGFLRPLCPDHLHSSDGRLHPADAVGRGGRWRAAARGLRRSLGPTTPQ